MAAEDFVFQTQHQHQWAVTTSDPGTYSHRERGQLGSDVAAPKSTGRLAYLPPARPGSGFYTPATPAKGHTGHTHFVFRHALASCLPTWKSRVFQTQHQHQWAVTTSDPGTYSHREREGNSGAMLLLLSLLVVWLTYLLLGQAVAFILRLHRPKVIQDTRTSYLVTPWPRAFLLGSHVARRWRQSGRPSPSTNCKVSKVLR